MLSQCAQPSDRPIDYQSNKYIHVFFVVHCNGRSKWEIGSFSVTMYIFVCMWVWLISSSLPVQKPQSFTIEPTRPSKLLSILFRYSVAFIIFSCLFDSKLLFMLVAVGHSQRSPILLPLCKVWMYEIMSNYVLCAVCACCHIKPIRPHHTETPFMENHISTNGRAFFNLNSIFS